MRVSILILLGVLVSACDPQQPTEPSDQTVMLPPNTQGTLAISPDPVPAIAIGQSVQLTASLNNVPSPDPRFVTWTSSSTAVASVGDSTGLVQCLTPGSAVITASANGFNLGSRSVDVTCNALFTVTPGTLLFEHFVGSSPCPQAVGTIRVTNTSGQTLTVVVSSQNAALQTDVSFVTLAAGATRDVAVAFNCGTQVSFSSAIAFSAVSGTVTENHQVGVTAAILR